MVDTDTTNFGDTLVFMGCSQNFLAEIDNTRDIIVSKSNGMIDKYALDYTIDSVKLIDTVINEGKRKETPYDPQVHCAYVAYIGEIIRRKLNGKWELHHVLDKAGDRYFPVIIMEEKKKIEVYGVIEKHISRLEASNLAKYVTQIDKPFNLKVEKVPTPLFPPINDK